MSKSEGMDWAKLSPETRAMLEKAATMVQPIRCTLVVGVDESAMDGVGKPILCGKPMLGEFGCPEKFDWGGRHGNEGNPQRDMKFADFSVIDALPPATGSSLNLDGLEEVNQGRGYVAHPVTDGGVGSGGRRKIVIVDGEIAGAVLGFLPKKFVVCYEGLLDKAYGERRLDASGSMGGDKGEGRVKARKTSGRTSSSSVDKTLAASGGGKDRNRAEIAFKNERAVDFRRLVDRRLRRIARDIEEFFAGDDGELRSGKRRCNGRCRKIGDSDWIYCARCGGPMQEVN